MTISVIMPVYNAEAYLPRSIECVRSQTFSDWELIIVDDGSSDKSAAIIDKYAEIDKRINVIHQKNAGPGIARNRGIDIATGDYIIHCDSDDWVDVTMYEKMYNKAIEEEADMVVCGYYRSDGVIHRENTGFISKEKEQFIREMLYMRTSWAVWNKLVKRELYHSKFNYPAGAMAEDMLTSTQLALFSNRISFLRENLYYYYDNPKSIVNTASYEACMRKFKQATDNASQLASIILNTPEYCKYREPLYYAMSFQKNLLLPYLHIAEAKDIFYRTFKGIESKVIFNPEVSLKERLRCLLIVSHLYTLINRK